MSAMVQFRFLGGALGLALATVAMNTYLRSQLTQSFSQAEVDALTKSAAYISGLSPGKALIARETFAQGYSLIFKITAGLCAAQFPAALMLWQKPQARIG